MAFKGSTVRSRVSPPNTILRGSNLLLATASDRRYICRVALDEQDLIRRANAGEQAALDLLYTEYREFILKVAMGFVGNLDDASDVLHDVFVYVYGKFPGFTLTASFKSFLYPAVKHTSLKLLKKKRKVVPIGERDFELLGWHVHQGEAKDYVEKLRKRLPHDQFELLAMRYGLGMKLGEIASALGKPEGTIKSRLHNLMKTLRNRETANVS